MEPNSSSRPTPRFQEQGRLSARGLADEAKGGMGQSLLTFADTPIRPHADTQGYG